MPPNQQDKTGLADDPLWFKDAIIYEIPTRAFYDSNGDGIGEFAGLIDKLDYVQDLGVTAIWILPFYPSPQRDGGYDIADYKQVNERLGTLVDFKRLLKEAHRRGIRVITELVINHTSDQHPWFERARRAPKGSKLRNFYVWSDDPQKYRDARIIFQDYETSNWTWDPVAKQYYWHRFYSHQPDLNFDNPDVQKAVFEMLDYWMAMGVDGMRLDAIPYLYEREGTNCENLPETHAMLKSLRAHIDERYKNRMLLAEANQWPEDAAEYYGNGDECHMNFHFPLMPRMFMSVQLESSFPILDILAQTPKIPENCQWAIFLRNHDELTLEMVTDEDRDFMYRVYAHDPQMRVNLGIRRRLAPLLKTRAKVELMNALLFSMPGTPVLYYGDEIGMGDNVYLGDRDAVRTPMQWSPDRNAGFSKANPQKLFLPVIIDPEHHYETVNVEAQQNNSDSLLWWTKRLIELRKKHVAFGRGEIELLHPDNGKILAFFRTTAEERLLVVANLSRYPQYAELDLSAYSGRTPVELFSRTPFPPIGDLPYLLTIGPHGFYWFELTQPAHDALPADGVARITTQGKVESLFTRQSRVALGQHLIPWLTNRRWYRGKARTLRSLSATEHAMLSDKTYFCFFEAHYTEGNPETYLVPISIVPAERGAVVEREHPASIIAYVKAADGEFALIDAVRSENFARDILALTMERGTLKSEDGTLKGRTTRALPGVVDRELMARRSRDRRDTELPAHVGQAEQSNTNIIFGEQLILKLLRVVEAGPHPEEEVGRFLTESARFDHVPRLVATLAYEPNKAEPGHAGATALAFVQELVRSQGDAWEFTLDALSRFLEAAWETAQRGPAPRDRRALVERTKLEPPEHLASLMGGYPEFARLLGQRTAELHLALASSTDNPAFIPEEFSLLHQRSLYQSAHTHVAQTMQILRKQLPKLEGEIAESVAKLIAHESSLDRRLCGIYEEKLDVVRTRIHGDLHLGQVLYVGGDVRFIDFEGEPARTLTERSRKRSPIRDVAGMLRSFHYAAAAALHSGRVRERDEAVLAPWAYAWADWVCPAWLAGWLETARNASFVPRDSAALSRLLDFYLLEKAMYEVRYELNNRPAWLPIPIRGVLEILETEGRDEE